MDKPVVDKGNFLSSCILCGDQAMLVVLVNQDFEASAEKFALRPVQGVTLRVRLPRFLKAAGVGVVNFPGGMPDLPAKIQGSRVEFSMNVGAGAIAVIYADEAVFEQMRRIHAKCLEKYQPLQEE
jgi:hypothetical protein